MFTIIPINITPRNTLYRTHREKHNLDRCRTQFKLVADMELKWDAMRKIVEKIASEN